METKLEFVKIDNPTFNHKRDAVVSRSKKYQAVRVPDQIVERVREFMSQPRTFLGQLHDGRWVRCQMMGVNFLGIPVVEIGRPHQLKKVEDEQK